MSEPGGAGSDGSRRRGRGLRTTLLLGILVPVLGLGGIAALEISDRLDSRHASIALEAQAAEVAEVADFLAALAREEVYSTIAAIATDLDLTDGHPDLEALGPRLAGARSLVDSQRFAEQRRSSGLEAELARVRDAVDAGTLTFDDARRQFTLLDQLIDTVWRAAMAEVERSGDAEPLPAHIRARVRALRNSMLTFDHADERIEPAIRLLLGPVAMDDLRALLEASSRFELSREIAEDDAGPRARARWEIIASDPAFARTEANIDLAVAIGTGELAPLPGVDDGAWVQGLRDGGTWATRLTDVVRAAALDLEEAAADRAAADTRAVGITAAVAVLLTLVAAGVAGAIARYVARPASALEAAARRIQAGDLDLPPVEAMGPRELAATVDAFNDMASTLAAVERHTVALAEEPSAALLEEPLPGRTGLAMQRAIDRLRTSMSEAEAHRAELFERATHDGLTGLLNRAAAFAAVERELARAERAGEELLALYVDLDGLKGLNDAHGHDVGDEAIVRTADALRSTTRDADVVARLGGDEFLVVGPVPPDGRDGIAAFAERIRRAVSLQEVAVDGDRSVPLRCSIGVVRTGSRSQTAEGLVRAADGAMYRAKRSGRDQVVWIDEPHGADPAPA